MKQSAMNRTVIVVRRLSRPCGRTASAQQVTGAPGSPGATTTIGGKQLPPPDPKFGGVIKEKASESKAWWAPRVVPPKGAPNVLLIMTDDCRLRRAGHVRRRHPDTGTGSHREERAALHEFPLHVALLADAGGDYHRTQPSLGRLRGGGRNSDGVPGLRLDHPDREGHHRHHPEGERVRNLVVRQGPQHALLPVEPGRAVRSMAERHGLRVLLRLRRRRRQPVAAEPVPQYDGHLSLRGQSRLEPDHGHGRRGDPVHEAAQGDRARQTVLCLLRAGRHPRAASSDAGVDQEDQRHAPVRRRLEQAARDDLRQPETAGHHARERQADAVAERTAASGIRSAGRRRSSSSSKRMSTGLTSPTPTTRSAGSSRPSKTSASSTTP